MIGSLILFWSFVIILVPLVIILVLFVIILVLFFIILVLFVTICRSVTCRRCWLTFFMIQSESLSCSSSTCFVHSFVPTFSCLNVLNMFKYVPLFLSGHSLSSDQLFRPIVPMCVDPTSLS